MKFRRICVIVVIASVCFGCNKNENDSSAIPLDIPANPVTPTYNNVKITTDKAAYSPGDEVTFTIDNATLPSATKVRYKLLNLVISETTVTGSSWKWKTPATDYRGYIAEVFAITNNAETIYSVSYTHLRAHETRHDL